MKKGSDMLQTIKGHPNKATCPRCNAPLGHVALVNIVYAFEPCKCDEAPYEHLVETLYHRECFAREMFLMPPPNV